MATPPTIYVATQIAEAVHENEARVQMAKDTKLNLKMNSTSDSTETLLKTGLITTATTTIPTTPPTTAMTTLSTRGKRTTEQRLLRAKLQCALLSSYMDHLKKESTKAKKKETIPQSLDAKRMTKRATPGKP